MQDQIELTAWAQALEVFETVVAAIGGLWLGFTVVTLLRLLAKFVLPSWSSSALLKRCCKDNAYAVVTGASEGIGREFSLQLAKKGFNLVILSRTKAKLDALKKELLPTGVNVLVVPFDFSSPEEKDWASLEKKLASLDITVLVNNVAMNHSIPTPFMEEDESLVQDILQVNVSSFVRVTRMLLKPMLAQKSGLIINMGSLSGQIPSAYLSVYSASKAFVRSFSQSLAMEVAPSGVHVEHVNAYFVTTAMSKIRRPSFTTPTPKAFVASVLASVGSRVSSVPYFSHALAAFFIGYLGEDMLVRASRDMHLNIRGRALRKREREAAKQKSS